MAVVSRGKRGRCLFPLSSAVSCLWDILRIRRVNKKCQHLSVLIESQLAGRLLGTAHNFSASSHDSLSVCFWSGDLKVALCGVSILEAPPFPWERHRWEWKHNQEDDLELSEAKTRWQLWQLQMS